MLAAPEHDFYRGQDGPEEHARGHEQTFVQDDSRLLQTRLELEYIDLSQVDHFDRLTDKSPARLELELGRFGNLFCCVNSRILSVDGGLTE